MKSLFYCFVLLFTINFCTAQVAKSNVIIASCCATEARKCTGSMSCTACTNCSGCKHCSSGGSCGVCSSGKNSNYTESKSSTSKNSSKDININFNFNVYKKGKTVTIARSVNLRKEPSKDSDVIAKISNKNTLKILGNTEEWVKVQVLETKIIGYILSSNLQ
ncbi:SH3 domain-containing protein [Flavobacterium sp. '19STA2R22 D10 B1']|uniref:SH3 domain-containing protein n=1 Tax=Flavobacterium aerium TaxID=3037261 RepID=UPI00278C4050|nr:SH3 domain-containing protein [Flavobacterium sp. '19STA2R22 D10 B1']